MLDMTMYESSHPKVIEAIEPQPGGSFMRREQERECRELLGTGRRAAIFRWNGLREGDYGFFTGVELDARCHGHRFWDDGRYGQIDHAIE
jgi:hypothetical protein